MPSRPSSTQIVIAGFAGVVVLMAGLITVGLYRLADLNAVMDDIAHRTVRRAEAVSTMRMVARERLVRLQSMYFLTDPFERDAEHMRYRAEAGRFIEARDSLLALDPAPAQQRLWQEARVLIGHDERLHREAIELIFADNAPAAGRLIQEQVIPMETALLAQLDAMLHLERAETRRTLAAAAQRYRQTFTLMLALALVTLAAAVATAVFVTRRSGRAERAIIEAKQHAEQAADQLAWAASHDALTGLPNRRTFETYLAELARSAREERAHHALAYIDLDRFKAINDAHGHRAGDALLVAIAELMRGGVRSGDTLARLGGDEFGLLLPHCAMEKAQALVAALKARVEAFTLDWHGHALGVGLSVGVVSLADGDNTVAELMHRADLACYAAKQRRRGGPVGAG